LLWLDPVPVDERPALLASIQPLRQAAAALMATLLEQGGQVAPNSLSIIRTAMREAATFVWEWDIVADTLGDIDEGALMLGYEPHQLGHTQQDWNRLIHPDDIDALEQAYQRHARGESSQYRAIYRARAADGQWRWIEECGRITERDIHGQPTWMCGTQTDATTQVALEQARRQQLEAEAANAAKTEFLSRVSHELRTPLNAVLGFSQLLESDPVHPLPQGQLRQVNLIRQAGEHLLAMIGDLLDVSLVESGRLQVQLEPMALACLLTDCTELLRAQAETAGIPILLDTGPPGLVVRADGTRLKQVVINLLTNAIKYNRPGGEVRLLARAGVDGTHQIEVHDTGLGIPADQMERLFEPFNRLGREHGPVPGAGLGLALSQMLVTVMGGELSASSDSSGTRFVACLPAAGGQPADPTKGHHTAGNDGLAPSPP
jgi:PAS domain S-box-containing protein